MLQKFGYRIRFLNTINMKKSMHYNPFAYIHSEKDILKLVTTLIANTKGVTICQRWDLLEIAFTKKD